MNLLPSLPRRARGAALTALLLAAVLFAALTGTATAAPGAGEVALTLKSAGKGSLGKQGVTATYSAKAGKTGSAKKRAQVGGSAQALALPVADLTLGKTPTVRTKGAIALALKNRSASLTDVTVQLGQKSTAISAKIDGSRVVFFRAKGTPRVDRSSVKLANAKLTLTKAGAKALRAALNAGGIASGQAGSATVDAALTQAKAVVPAPAPTPTAPPVKIDGGGLKPDPSVPYPYEAQCPVANVAGGPGFGRPPGTIAGIAPAPAFNPGTAQTVNGESIAWGFKTSFRSYILSVTPGSLQTLDGAGAAPAGPTMASAGSTFDFPVAEGSYEPGTAPGHGDDKLVSEGTGTVLFCSSGHGFSIVIKDPTITIDGANSRITADVGTNIKGTWYPFQRTDIAELDLSGVTPQISDGGNTLVWEDIPAKMSADGFAATGELYNAGTALDAVTVRTKVERPLSGECAIDAGVGTPPAVDFTRAALPTLSNPVTGSGGTINWGFRRSLRSSVQSTGSFQLLGGATAGYPGNMGGGATPAPTGGIGKFFRFPIAEYAYEAGTVDPADDRLIATSNATVSFCNPAAGNYGLVISKPTLVIDGASSRLVANAYSYRNPDLGWAGGRVDLVALDDGTISAIAESGTVRWGDVPADNNPIETGIAVSGGLSTNALTLANLAQGAGGGGFDPVTAQIALPTP